jgi:hypothetical protein
MKTVSRQRGVPIPRCVNFWQSACLTLRLGHGYCYLWKPEIVWLHAGSDAPDHAFVFCKSLFHVWHLHSYMRLDPPDGNLDAVEWHLPAGRGY